jgi:hypothetical protein
VLTDGFGPVSNDLKARLGSIKLHVILIPDLDIAKILDLYPDRKTWEDGGPQGTRPMPEFWQYYSKEPPPLRLEGDLYENTVRSYETAGKSVKELKRQEILQGLNQIYTIREHCENFIFVVITALFGETFKCYEEDINSMAAAIEELKQLSIEQLTHNEKLSLLQTLNFMSELLLLALERAAKKTMKSRIRELLKMVGILKAQLLADPWLLSTIKVADDPVDIKLTTTMSSFFKDLPLGKALAMLIKFLWQTFRESAQRFFAPLRKFHIRQEKV